MQPVMKASIRWDEGNLQHNEQESLAAQRMKIDEPKTPFHYLEDDGEEPVALPPKAAPAKVASPKQQEAYHEQQLQPGMHDIAALAASALERREAEEARGESSEEEISEEGKLATPNLHPAYLPCTLIHSRRTQVTCRSTF